MHINIVFMIFSVISVMTQVLMSLKVGHWTMYLIFITIVSVNVI